MSNNLLQSPSHHPARAGGRSTRRSLRERLRDGVSTVSTAAANPFQQSSKSKSIDSSTPSNLYQQTTTAAMDFLSSPFELITNRLKSNSHELYTVQPNDTLTSIAANYESTPSELIKLNKLGSRLVLPGQVLKIPVNKSNVTPGGRQQEAEEKRDDFCTRKFIKLGVRHVTDGNGVISGTLLVTPNAVMFDPNVSDPLVIEQGAELYGVILPFELIAAAGIYNDISGMKVRGVEPVETGHDVVLYPPQPSAGATDGAGDGEKGLPVFDECGAGPEETPAPAHTSPRRAHSSSSSASPPVGHDDIKSKVLKRLSFPLTWSFGEGTEERSKYRSLVSLEDVPDLRASFEKLLPGPHPPSSAKPPPSPPPPQHSSSSYASFTTSTTSTSDENWFLCLTTGFNPENKPKLGHMVSYGSKTQCKPEYWFGVNSAGDVEELYRFWMLWWPHLYGKVDAELISSRGMTLVDWETNIFDESQAPAQQQQTTAEQLGDLGKESWEMLKAPYTKLYSFIRTGLSSTSSSTDLEWGSALDFFDVTTDPEEQSKVVSMTEELHRLLQTSAEYDHYVPELTSPSEILSEQDVESIARHLTARAQGYPWCLVFSTTRHGFSLSTLYRRMEEVENSSPVLVVVEDTRRNVFGALLSTPLRLSDHFYGTGQSFLFQLRAAGGAEEIPTGEDDPESKPKPEFRLYKWTGENNYFIKGNLESVSVGAGDGHFGLWLDSDLFVGRSEHCSTYNNPPLVEEKDFVVKTLECWGFGGGVG